MGLVAGVVVGLLVIIFLFALIWASRYIKVGPNECLIVSGIRRKIVDPRTGKVQTVGYRLIKGGGAFIWPVFEQVQHLSLEIMTLNFKTPEVYTNRGVSIMIEGVAQIKVRSDEISIATAAEMFLSKGRAELMNVAHQTLEGHIRDIVSQLTVEEVYRDREKFAQRVQEVSAVDFGKMGLEVVSLTIQKIEDAHGYLEALGVPRIAEVKRDAQVAQAEANRDATIRSAMAKKEGEQARFQAETEIAQAQRDFETRKAEYQAQINSKKAEADLAYDLQKYKTSQLLKAEEVKILEVEKERMIQVQEKEISRKQKELEATVQKPAEAERSKIQALADAERYRIEAEALAKARATKEVGFAEADASKAKGLATAEVIKAQGESEATAMMKKADAWREYTGAAIAQIYIERLPEVVRSISEPLSKVDKIVIISSGGDSGPGASRITKDIVDIVAQLPPLLESASGVKLKDLIAKIPGLLQEKSK